jgi:hypothetical protein
MSIKKSDYFLITGDMVPSKNVTNAFNESGLGEFDELFKNSKEVLINYIPSKYIKTFSFVDLYDKNSKTYKELKDNKSLE